MKPMSQELVYGTRNPSKLSQAKEALKGLDVHLVGLDDNVDVEVEEDGTSPEENARKKARAYAKHLGKTVLSMDAALYFDGVEDESQPGLYVRRIPGNSSASDDEVLAYYTNFIKERGGTLEGRWKFSFALGYPDGYSIIFSSETPRTFVATADTNVLPGYPLESIQIDQETGKYISELSAEEQAERWQETLGAPLAAFIKHYVTQEDVKEDAIVFSTGNNMKFVNGLVACEKYGISLKHVPLKIDEIQNEIVEYIIEDKAKESFAELGTPVIVSDDSWEIPGLNGFPGAYMKYMNIWLKPENFLDLTRSLQDRRVFLHSRLAYADGNTVKLFLRTFEGELLKESRGSSGPPSQKVIALKEDNGLSISEVYDDDPYNKDRDVHKIWDDFCSWYQEYTTSSKA